MFLIVRPFCLSVVISVGSNNTGVVVYVHIISGMLKLVLYSVVVGYCTAIVPIFMVHLSFVFRE
jgi:hypothetical protein